MEQNIDEVLYNLGQQVISMYMNLKVSDATKDHDKELVPVIFGISSDDDNDNNPAVLQRVYTTRISNNVHHLSFFNHIKDAILIAMPGNTDFYSTWETEFLNRTFKFEVHIDTYYTTDFNNILNHHIASGVLEYTVELYPLYNTIADDKNYTICAIKNILSDATLCNVSFKDSFKYFMGKIDDFLKNDKIDYETVQYPEKIVSHYSMVRNAIMNMPRVSNDIDERFLNIPLMGTENSSLPGLDINVKYLDPEMPRIEIIEKGDWIDLCTVTDISMKAGDFTLIPLGVIIQIPKGYEALLLPRSSTFKKYGILVANSMGVIDNSYRGPEDQWMVAAYATRDIEIPKYTRIAQFRLLKNQPKITINEIDEVIDDSRGGFGSTGN